MAQRKRSAQIVRSVIYPVIIDKLMAFNVFFLIWMTTALIRWKFYERFSYADILNWSPWRLR